jgi:hypothetical protein
MFQNGFQGDQIGIDYILRTLEAKTYVIPGVTANPRVTVSVAGDSAYYLTQPAASVGAKVTLGGLHTWTDGDSKGVSRKVVDLSKGYPIYEIIPFANYATVAADVVGERVTVNALERANQCNREYLTELVTNGTPKTYAATITADNVLSTLLGAIADFNTLNKAKYLTPTAMFVSESVLQALREKNLIIFKDAVPGENDQILGFFNKVAVIEAQDLAAGEFVLMNYLGAGQVQNLRSFFIKDGSIIAPGSTILTGEIGVASTTLDKDLVLYYKKAA